MFDFSFIPWASSSKSDALSLSINPLLLLSPNMSCKYSVWTFSGMNKELILRLMLSCTCFVQAKNCAMGNSLDRPVTIDFCLSHPTNSLFSMSLFSPFRVLNQLVKCWGTFISVNHHGAREVWMCRRILVVKHQGSVRCCSDKEGADVICHINTKD